MGFINSRGMELGWVGKMVQVIRAETFQFGYRASLRQFRPRLRSSHSVRTLASPRNLKLRKPKADLRMPIAGSTVIFRKAYKALPAGVANRWRSCSRNALLCSRHRRLKLPVGLAWLLRAGGQRMMVGWAASIACICGLFS